MPFGPVSIEPCLRNRNLQSMRRHCQGDRLHRRPRGHRENTHPPEFEYTCRTSVTAQQPGTAAVEFQTANTAHNTGIMDEIRPELRVGIAMGEVVIADITVTGEGIVLAQRLEQLTDPGGTCVQGAAYDKIPKRLPFDYENLGEHELKGFKDPVRVYAVRPQSMTGVLKHDKESILKLAQKPSIAVLPLNNMSGDPEQEYFSDGITEDVITELSRFSVLHVVARQSSLAFKGEKLDIRDIAEKLGVQYAVEGSVRSIGRIKALFREVGMYRGTV